MIETTGVIRAVRATDLEVALREALSSEPVTLGVAGGDGTLRAAAELAAGGPTAIAPIPTGTINHFARRLGITGTHHFAAIGSLARGLGGYRTVRVPIGVFDDTVFLNSATFGAYAGVVMRRDERTRGRARWLAAAAATAHVVRRLEWRDVEIVLPGGAVLERYTPLIWVRTPEPHSAAAQLEVIVFHLEGRLNAARCFVRLLPRIAADRLPRDDPALEIMRTPWMLLRAERPLGITLDGEPVVAAPPYWIAACRDALAVVLPER